MKNVQIINETKYKFPFEDLIQKIASTIGQKSFSNSNFQMSLIIVSGQKMAAISKKYRQKYSTTDILSFPIDWKETEEYIGYKELGDIYMSFKQIHRQAKSFGHSLEREWSYMFAHGMFHLLGFDHKTTKEETIMNMLVDKTMKDIKVSRYD